MTSPITEPNPINTVLLSTTAHQFARAFAAEQMTVQHGKQVYLNTLAVYALHTYLGRARISTDLEASYSWNPNLRALENHCGLLLPGIGRIEGCPVLPDANYFTSPSLSPDSIAYIAVQFSESLAEVQLLGYLPIIGREDIPDEVNTSDLFPIDQLTDFLFRIQDGLELIEHNNDGPDVQELLRILEEEGRSLVEVIVRMEQLRNDEWRWDFEGINTIKPPDLSSQSLLANATLSGKGEQTEATADEEIKELAKSLLQKLKAVWDETE